MILQQLKKVQPVYALRSQLRLRIYYYQFSKYFFFILNKVDSALLPLLFKKKNQSVLQSEFIKTLFGFEKHRKEIGHYPLCLHFLLGSCGKK